MCVLSAILGCDFEIRVRRMSFRTDNAFAVVLSTTFGEFSESMNVSVAERKKERETEKNREIM